MLKKLYSIFFILSLFFDGFEQFFTDAAEVSTPAVADEPRRIEQGRTQEAFPAVRILFFFRGLFEFKHLM